MLFAREERAETSPFDDRTCGHAIAVVRACDFLQTCKTNRTILLADRQAIRVVRASPLMSKMVGSCWVAASYRTFLKVALQNIAA